MRNRLLVLAVAAVALAAGLLSNAGSSDAAFHLMRVYGVMGGANGDSTVQYVELRMTDPGQSVVAGHDICFFDASGVPVARFTFPGNVAVSADESSILIGSAAFDTAWAVGSPDFSFSGNTVALPGGAPVTAPVVAGSGKVSFGSDSSSNPATMCAGSFSVIDSVAYGSAYTGAVDFPTKFASDLPTSGTQAIRLQGPICIPGGSSPCPSPRNNSADYALVDVNTSGNNPRNNTNQSGPVAPPPGDDDNDGVTNGSDLCPDTAPAAPVDANGCSQFQVDRDADGFCTLGAPSGGPAPGCTGTDNCPSWANPAQNLPSWNVPAGDEDCDGFSTAIENFIVTDPHMHCPANNGTNNEDPDAWPTDLNDNQVTNTIDVGQYVGKLNKTSPDPLYVKRLDLNGNNTVNTIDVGQFVGKLNKNCTA